MKSLKIIFFIIVCIISGSLFYINQSLTQKNIIEIPKENIIEISNKEIQEIFSNSITSVNLDVTLDNFINGETTEYTGDLTLPYDWSCQNLSRTDAYRMHGFINFDYIYNDWVETQNPEIPILITDWIIDWIESNPIVLEGDSEMAWHDDSVARRVFRMSYYYYLWKDLFTDTEKELIEKSLSEQAELLATEEFYTDHNNHGMYQDMGLISYSILVETENEIAKEYLKLASQRTKTYIDNVFTVDGVHKEHSPNYHIDICLNLKFFSEIYENFDSDFSKYMNYIYDNASLFIFSLIQPDGTIPSIGDSRRQVAGGERFEVFEESSEYQFYFNNEGSPLTDNIVFPESGYSIFKSPNDTPIDEKLYILFTAATFSSTHKHSDDLSFILYYKGDLFVEAGNRNYSYLEEMSAYAYSSFAHNVLVVNDEEFPVKIGPSGFRGIYPEALETKITYYDIDTNIKTVIGEQSRYENATQTRRIDYDSQNNTVEITDIITASEDLKGTLIYHIAAGVEIINNQNGWDLLRDGEIVAEIVIESDKSYTLESYHNEEGEAPYYTWIFEGNDDPELASLLKVNIDCNEGTNEVKMTIYLK